MKVAASDTADEAAIRQAAAAVGEALAESAIARNEARKSFVSVLTDEQKQKIEEAKAKFRETMKQRQQKMEEWKQKAKERRSKSSDLKPADGKKTPSKKDDGPEKKEKQGKAGDAATI